MAAFKRIKRAALWTAEMVVRFLEGWSNWLEAAERLGGYGAAHRLRENKPSSTYYGHQLQRGIVAVRISDLRSGDIVGLTVELPHHHVWRFKIVDVSEHLVDPIDWRETKNTLKLRTNVLSVGGHVSFAPIEGAGIMYYVPVEAIDLNGQTLTFQDAIRLAAQE